MISVKQPYTPPVIINYGRLADLTRGWGGQKIDMILGLVPVNNDCSTPTLGGLITCAS